MNKTTELVFAGIAVLLIVVSLVFVFSVPMQKHRFELESDGVLFVSDFAHPGEQLKSFSKSNSFIISSEFLESGTTSFMTQALTLFSSVLVTEDKFVVVVAKTVDGSGNLLVGCDTNDGNKLVNRQISAKECNELFENSPHTVFFVALPDASLPQSRVTVFENSVLIEPNSFEDVPKVCFLVLKTMYSDSAETVDLINRMLELVKV